MEEYRGSFSIISLADYYNRRRDRDGERIRINELLDPEDDNTGQSHKTHRIVQGFSTNHILLQQRRAVTFYAGIIDSQSDEAFGRNTIDFCILTSSLGITGLRAVGYLREDYTFSPTATQADEANAWWQVRPVPIDIDTPSGVNRPRQHITDGFFTRWPSNHDLQKLIADSLSKPE